MFEENVLQLCQYSPPNYIKKYNYDSLNWNYDIYKFKDIDLMEEFILKNPSKLFPNSHELFKKFNDIELKYSYFIFYNLFIRGGIYINENIFFNQNIKLLDFSKKMIIVESKITPGNIFNGFIFCHKNSKIIELFLKKIETKFNEQYFNNNHINTYLQNELYNDVTIYNNICINLNNQIEIIICNENVSNNISNIYDQDINIVYMHHYFNSVKNIFTLPEHPIQLPSSKNINNLKIGVTFNITKTIADMFSNGINQNSLYLGELLLNIGHDVYFIIDGNKLTDECKNVIDNILYDSRFKYVQFSDIFTVELDILIQLSFSFWNDIKLIKTLKYTNVKLVGYFCGNSYIINSEKILYSQHKNRDNDKESFNYIFDDGSPIFDEIWSIPQMVNTNLHYWKILYRCKCIEVPFIWSNKSYHLTFKQCKLTENDIFYTNRGIKKKIGIFEPNISVMKWALPCILICENCYRKNKNIEHLFITNIKSNHVNPTIDTSNNILTSTASTFKINEFNIQTFNHILTSLDIFNDKLCSIEARYNTMYFMFKYCDIAVSHQWENPLNYLYFDLAWMGWPIVHNAHLCKDIGYYYEGFNYEDGGNMLDHVLQNHDNNVDDYINKNREAIDRYLPSNETLQNNYKQIINQLILNV
jgi:hypothetical protein